MNTEKTPGASAAAGDHGPPGSAPGLEAAALDRLRELDPDGRHGVLQRVLAAFETVLTRMLAQLDAQGGDPAVVTSVAHTLKSSSASVGAAGLARACAEIEHRLRAGATGDLAADVARLQQEGQGALRAVRAMLRP